MSNKIDRRSFLKVLGIAGAACAMTALTGCDEEGTPSFPAGDGSVSLSSLKHSTAVCRGMEDGCLRILLEMFTQEEQTMQYSHTEVAGGIRGKAGRI